MRLELACGKDPMRESIHYVRVDTQNCVATDAHIMAVYPTSAIFDPEFIAALAERELPIFIFRDDWKVLASATSVSWQSEDIIEVRKGKARPKFLKATKGLSYPVWEQAIPEHYDDVEAAAVYVDAKHLSNLQGALGVSAMRMVLKGAARAIMCYPYDSKHTENVGQKGLIMPMSAPKQ